MQVQIGNYNNINFSSASDITIKYVLEKHSNILPKRMKSEIESILANPQSEMPKLYELHNRVYKRLFEAKSLEEVKQYYPEYSEILELSTMEGNRSKAIKAVKAKGIPLKDFTLDFIKKLFSPVAQEDIVKEYNFTNRSLVLWLIDKLHISKFNGNYINLLRMSDEAENSRIAELSRQAIYRMPEVQKARQEKVAMHHRTTEYREKKRAEMVDFYKRNPFMAERVSLLSKLTWKKCPEIKEALNIYTAQSPDYVKSILSKKRTKEKLTDMDKRILHGYYKGFWSKHPEYREIYSRMRTEAAKELGYHKD